MQDTLTTHNTIGYTNQYTNEPHDLVIVRVGMKLAYIIPPDDSN